MIALLLALIATTTGIPRNVDPGLMNAAQVRAESVVCADASTFYQHTGHPAGAYEILTCSSDVNQTQEQALAAWMASTPHRDVLQNGNLRFIGCGTAITAGYRMWACELSRGAYVPNTAVTVSGWFTASGLLLLVAAFAARRRMNRPKAPARGYAEGH